jgi:hypothetical protein
MHWLGRGVSVLSPMFVRCLGYGGNLDAEGADNYVTKVLGHNQPHVLKGV